MACRPKLVLTKDAEETKLCKKELEDYMIKFLKQKMTLDRLIRENSKKDNNISKIRLEIATLQRAASIAISSSVEEMLNKLE